jgi:hypothetical protein
MPHATTPHPRMTKRAPLQPRLMMVTGAVLAAGALGVALLVGSPRPSGEAMAEAAAAPAMTVSGVGGPPAASSAADPSSSTTTSPPAATGPATTAGSTPAPALPTGPAAPPQPTPTTMATAPRPRPSPAPPPAPPVTRPAAAVATDPAAQLQQVEAIADTSGWDWRTVHVHFTIGFDPAACCHWGVYDPTDHKTIWIGPTAFGDPGRLRYVVLHELAHAWQWHSHRLTKLEGDMAPWGYSGLDALEAGADCIATDWGAEVSLGHYWTCPAAAQALMATRLSGQWK